METILGHSFDKERPRALDVDILPGQKAYFYMHPPRKIGPEKIVVALDVALSVVQRGNGQVAGETPRGEPKTLKVRQHPKGLCIIIGRWWGVFCAEAIQQALTL